MGKKEIRAEHLMKLIHANGTCSLKDLAKILEVTHATVRRDVQELLKQNKVRLFHGVVAAIDFSSSNRELKSYKINEAETQNIYAKRKIAEKGVSRIKTGEIIFLDAGTTTELIARFADPEIELTIITCALNIADYVAENTKWSLVVPGGYLHRGPLMFESDTTADFIKNIRTNRAFISASGVTTNLGITCTNFFEIKVKQAALQSTQESILVSDTSKFGEVQVAYFADIEDFDLIITDSELNKDVIAYCTENSVQIDCI